MLQTGVVTGSWSDRAMGEPLLTACRVLKVRAKAPKKPKAKGKAKPGTRGKGAA